MSLRKLENSSVFEEFVAFTCLGLDFEGLTKKLCQKNRTDVKYYQSETNSIILSSETYSLSKLNSH